MSYTLYKPIEPKPTPEIGKIYNFYDDGKVRRSRHALVKILDIIPFSRKSIVDQKIDKNVYSCICTSIYGNADLYGDIRTHTIIIKAEAIQGIYGDKTEETRGQDLYLVRTTDGGWFSCQDLWLAGRLDVDHTLTDEYLQYLMERCPEFYSKEEIQEFLNNIV